MAVNFRSVGLLCVLGVCGACTSPSETPVVTTPEVVVPANATEVIATVGDKTLTRAVFERKIAQQIEMLKAQSNVMQAPEMAKQLRSMVEGLVIQGFITNTLVANYAAQTGCILTEEDLANYPHSTAELPDCFTEEEKVAFLRENALVNKVFQRIMNAVTMDEATIAAAQKAHQQDFQRMATTMREWHDAILAGTISFENLVEKESLVKQPVTFQADQLKDAFPPQVLAVINATPVGEITEVVVDPEYGMLVIFKVLNRTRPEGAAEEPSAEEKLTAIRERILAGEDFATLAAEFSECPSGARDGGNLGEFGKGMMVPEFETVVFQTPVGALSPVFKTPFGYHIVKVTARDDAGERVTASHILVTEKVTDGTTELAAVMRSLAPLPNPTTEKERFLHQLQDLAVFEFLREQRMSQSVTCPYAPALLQELQ